MFDVLQSALDYHSRLKRELAKIDDFLRMADRLCELSRTEERTATVAVPAKAPAPTPQEAAPEKPAHEKAEAVQEQAAPTAPKPNPVQPVNDSKSNEIPISVEPWGRNDSGAGARRGLAFRGAFEDGPSELDRRKVVS